MPTVILLIKHFRFKHFSMCLKGHGHDLNFKSYVLFFFYLLQRFTSLKVLLKVCQNFSLYRRGIIRKMHAYNSLKTRLVPCFCLH